MTDIIWKDMASKILAGFYRDDVVCVHKPSHSFHPSIYLYDNEHDIIGHILFGRVEGPLGKSIRIRYGTITYYHQFVWTPEAITICHATINEGDLVKRTYTETPELGRAFSQILDPLLELAGLDAEGVAAVQ